MLRPPLLVKISDSLFLDIHVLIRQLDTKIQHTEPKALPWKCQIMDVVCRRRPSVFLKRIKEIDHA